MRQRRQRAKRLEVGAHGGQSAHERGGLSVYSELYAPAGPPNSNMTGSQPAPMAEIRGEGAYDHVAELPVSSPRHGHSPFTSPS